MKQINPRNADQLAGAESAIKQMFDRHSNVLEIHLRYRQPSESTVCSIIPEEKLRLSKFACKLQMLWVFAAVLGYMIPMAFLFIVAPLMGIGIALHAPHALIRMLSNVLLCAAFYPYFAPFIIPTLYFLLFVMDMKLAWKDDIQATYRGPTHISLSPLSMKLLWKGALAVSIGAMFGWDEISFVELELPDDITKSSVPSIVITAKNGQIVHTVPIRLDGFLSDDDRLLFLNYIDNHVASECKTAEFKEYLSSKYKTEFLLNKLKDQVDRHSFDVDHELSALEISIEKKAGLICSPPSNDEDKSAERITIVPAKTASPIPSSFDHDNSVPPVAKAIDRSHEDYFPS